MKTKLKKEAAKWNCRDLVSSIANTALKNYHEHVPAQALKAIHPSLP